MGGIVALFLLGGGLYAATDGRYLSGVVVAAIGIPFAKYAARSFGYLAPKTARSRFKLLTREVSRFLPPELVSIPAPPDRQNCGAILATTWRLKNYS